MKKPRRRPLRGRPLLVAGAGATVLVAGCAGAGSKNDPYSYTSGNLVAPPTVQLCAEVKPPEAAATVTASGQQLPSTDPSCVEVYEGSVQISASAEGYAPYEETIEVYGDTNHTITLTAEAESE